MPSSYFTFLNFEKNIRMMIRGRQRWHGHLERNADAHYVKACARLVVEGPTPVGRPRKTSWQNTLSWLKSLLKIDPPDVHDQKKWLAIGWHKANPAASSKEYEDVRRLTASSAPSDAMRMVRTLADFL